MSSSQYQLRVSTAAQRGLDRLPPKVAIAIVEFMTTTLLTNPERMSKPLAAELAGLRSARRGDYRVLLRIDAQPGVVEVVRIAHRAVVYRP